MRRYSAACVTFLAALTAGNDRDRLGLDLHPELAGEALRRDASVIAIAHRPGFAFALSANAPIFLDSGEEVTMHPGDVMVQAGSNKAWEVRGEEPATFGVVMCASVAVGVTPPGDQRAGDPLPAGVVLPVDAGATGGA